MTHSNISQEEESDALVFFQDSGIIEWNNKRPFPSTQTYDLLWLSKRIPVKIVNFLP